MRRRTVLRATSLPWALPAAACARDPHVFHLSPAAAPPQSALPEARSGPPVGAPTPDQPAVWQREWDALAAAATQEGHLSLLTVAGRGYRALIDQFELTFPGITVDHLAESSADTWLTQLRQSRLRTPARASAFDVALGVQPDRALTDGLRDGLWAPLKPLLFRPDVLDASAWRDGFDARFLDRAGTHCLAWSRQIFHAYAINTDLVPETAIRSVQDLLDPRWKGKIISPDPRLGMGLLSAAGVAHHWGNGLLRQLVVDQRPVLVNGGPESVTEPLARGRYPIALGVRPKALDPLRAQGIGHQVRHLDLPDADFIASSPLLYVDGAPHPAAAQLFANWVLTPEAQSVLAASLPTNSARTDVAPGSPDETGAVNGPYYEPDREASFQHTADTQRLVRTLLANTR